MIKKTAKLNKIGSPEKLTVESAEIVRLREIIKDESRVHEFQMKRGSNGKICGCIICVEARRIARRK